VVDAGVRPAKMTAVSIGPIVTNSVAKLDSRLEGKCIEIFRWIGSPRRVFHGSIEDVTTVGGCE
jgi:hypothetical protein